MAVRTRRMGRNEFVAKEYIYNTHTYRVQRVVSEIRARTNWFSCGQIKCEAIFKKPPPPPPLVSQRRYVVKRKAFDRVYGKTRGK